MIRALRRPRAVDEDESECRNLVILLIVVTTYAAAGVVLLVVASHLHGPLRYVLGAIGLVGIGFLALWIGALVVAALGWGFFTATFRAQPSAAQWAVWLFAAILAGAFVGAGPYEVGPIGVFTGPLILSVIAAALTLQGFDRVYMNRRIIGFAAIAAAVAVPVGLTIFL